MTDSIFPVTSINLDTFSQFWAQIILAIRVSEKLKNVPSILALRNDDVIVTSLKIPLSQEEKRQNLFSLYCHNSLCLQCGLQSRRI